MPANPFTGEEETEEQAQAARFTLPSGTPPSGVNRNLGPQFSQQPAPQPSPHRCEWKGCPSEGMEKTHATLAQHEEHSRRMYQGLHEAKVQDSLAQAIAFQHAVDYAVKSRR